MMDDWNEFDYEALKEILPREEVVKIWSKLEIARILSDRVRALVTEVKNDIEFNMTIAGLRDE